MVAVWTPRDGGLGVPDPPVALREVAAQTPDRPTRSSTYSPGPLRPHSTAVLPCPSKRPEVTGHQRRHVPYPDTPLPRSSYLKDRDPSENRLPSVRGSEVPGGSASPSVSGTGPLKPYWHNPGPCLLLPQWDETYLVPWWAGVPRPVCEDKEDVPRALVDRSTPIRLRRQRILLQTNEEFTKGPWRRW